MTHRISFARGDTQPWKLGRFYGDSRFAFGHQGAAYKVPIITKYQISIVIKVLDKDMAQISY